MADEALLEQVRGTAAPGTLAPAQANGGGEVADPLGQVSYPGLDIQALGRTLPGNWSRSLPSLPAFDGARGNRRRTSAALSRASGGAATESRLLWTPCLDA